MPTVTPQSYLDSFDAHLATIASASERATIIEAEIRRTHDAERALERWCWRGRGKRPTPFSAIELATIMLELSRRLLIEREQVCAMRVAAE